MGTFHFTLKYDIDLSRCTEIAQRMEDFSIPFGKIIDNWAASNVLKFGAGKGSESSGFSGGALTPSRWEPLTEKYRAAKEKKGFSNWLMVRTGDLMSSLTSRGAFAEFIDAHRAVFGTPLDAEDADKALYNSETRPTVFLSESNRLNIRSELQAYISLGGDYKALLMARAGRLQAMKNESYQMDLAFAEASGG